MTSAEPLPVRRGRAKSRTNDIPFGVRAIESGIEVEGVWISRSNSPAPTSTGTPPGGRSPVVGASPAGSVGSAAEHGGAGQRGSQVPSIAMPEPMYPTAAYAPSAEQADQRRSGALSPPNGPVPSSLEPGYAPVRNPSPGLEAGPRPRPSYKPRQSSGLRFSTGDVLVHPAEREEAQMKRKSAYAGHHGTSSSLSKLQKNMRNRD